MRVSRVTIYDRGRTATALLGLCVRRYVVCNRCTLSGNYVDVSRLNPSGGITMCLEIQRMRRDVCSLVM